MSLHKIDQPEGSLKTPSLRTPYYRLKGQREKEHLRTVELAVGLALEHTKVYVCLPMPF